MFSIMHAKRRELMSVEDFFRFFDLCLLLSLKQFNERTTSDGQRTKCQKSMCNPRDTQKKGAHHIVPKWLEFVEKVH